MHPCFQKWNSQTYNEKFKDVLETSHKRSEIKQTHHCTGRLGCHRMILHRTRQSQQFDPVTQANQYYDSKSMTGSRLPTTGFLIRDSSQMFRMTPTDTHWMPCNRLSAIGSNGLMSQTSLFTPKNQYSIISTHPHQSTVVATLSLKAGEWWVPTPVTNTK